VIAVTFRANGGGRHGSQLNVSLGDNLPKREFASISTVVSRLNNAKNCYNPSSGAGEVRLVEPNAGSGKEICMLSRSMLRIFLVATILLVAAVAASAAAPADQAIDNSVGAIHTYLAPDLSLKSSFLLPTTALPAEAAHRKTCRCSCGTAFCATDADCGGGVGSCSAFISCCAKGDAGLRFSGSDQASRKHELPVFKGSCN
jgi:hypothetical protein